MNYLTISLIFLMIFASKGYGQKTIIVVDSATLHPIEAANAVVLKYKKGASSDFIGRITLNETRSGQHDTIAITHINYNPKLITLSEFLKSDSIFLTAKISDLDEFIVKSNINIDEYKRKNIFGFFHFKEDNGFSNLGFRSGFQVGLKIENMNGLKGIISNIMLHFEKLPPRVKFRVRVMKINKDGSIGEDLLKDGIIITPHSRRPKINIKDHRIFFPSNGVFVCVDHLGDGKTYPSRLDEPISEIRMTHRHSKSLTYDNYREVEWTLFPFKYKGKPTNAQIQVTVLSKK